MGTNKKRPACRGNPPSPQKSTHTLKCPPTHPHIHNTQRAAYLKEAGNAAFKAQDMGRAEARYSEAIGVLQVGGGFCF